MEDQKINVDEKRLSKGVIRRRSAAPTLRTEDEPEVEQPQVVAPPAAVAPVVAAPVAAAAVAVTPVKAKAVPPGLKVLGTLKKVEAPKPEVKAVPVAPASTVPEVKTAAPAAVVPPVVVAPAKPEEKRVLTFKDRIRGTIALKPVDRKDGTVTAAMRRPQTRPGEEVAPGVETEADKADPKKDKAAVKPRKSVKEVGGDLDIEGLGRATNLQQLNRTLTVERVFRPGPGGGGGFARKKKIISRKGLKTTSITQKKASKRVVEINGAITVGNLAQQLGVKAGEIIKRLMGLGVMATLNQIVDHDTTVLIATEYQYEVKDVAFNEDHLLQEEETAEENLEGQLHRPPVVTIMGHVDHGKTSLLDAIRSTNVTAGEAGGITQHIGAYTVALPTGKITFLDTPGHEAFAAMRARGAQVTDLIILVVAADDGIMPQTIESISHAQAAGVPIIVAVNKIDKEGANPDKVYRQLSEKGLLAESWGGDTIFVHVSALKKTGIEQLLESILLQSEMLELKANPERRASGTALEAKLDRARGAVCSLLVQDGTLRVGDYLVIGSTTGKVRAMMDWQGIAVKEAGPSTAVEILGIESVPDAGEEFNSVESEQDARTIAEHRQGEKRKIELASQTRTTADMFTQLASGTKEFSVIIKTDVHGSLEAIRDAVEKISTDEVKAKVIHGGVGGITESDVNLALATSAMIIGFNVRPETSAIHLAKEKGVNIELHKIIYDLVNDVKLAMQGLLEPIKKENYLGRAEVKQVFEVSKLGFVAGSMVNDGVITRNANIRLLRDNVVIFEGKITSLKRFKDDAREVKQGFECGVGIEGFKDLKAGDTIEAYEVELIQKTL